MRRPFPAVPELAVLIGFSVCTLLCLAQSILDPFCVWPTALLFLCICGLQLWLRSSSLSDRTLLVLILSLSFLLRLACVVLLRALYAVNLLCSLGLNWFIYATDRRFASERAALTAALLYAVAPSSFLYAGLLTNQHSAAFFIYLGLYLLSEDDPGPRRSAAAGLCLFAGNLLRPEAVLAVASVLVAGLILLLRSPGRESFFRIVLQFNHPT